MLDTTVLYSQVATYPSSLVALIIHIICAISSPDCPTMVRKAFCCCCCCLGDRERRTALHSCCRREVGSRGCEERWKCCSMRRWGGDRAEDIAGATSVSENGAAVRVGGCKRRWACCRTDVEGEFDSLSIPRPRSSNHHCRTRSLFQITEKRPDADLFITAAKECRIPGAARPCVKSAGGSGAPRRKGATEPSTF